MTHEERIDVLLSVVKTELMVAEIKHPPMNSPHEGWAVIREEVDELWDEVKADRGRTFDAEIEAVQIAAMGIRYALNLCGNASGLVPPGGEEEKG